MANILLLEPIIPYPPQYNGQTLRVFPLSCELAKRHNCYLAVDGENDARLQALRERAVYKDILLLPKSEGWNMNKFHWININRGHLEDVRRPEYYKHVTSALATFAAEKAIDIVISHYGMRYYEAFDGMPKILDRIDSVTLKLRREWSYYRESQSFLNRAKFLLTLYRSRLIEAALSNVFDFVLTVSSVDQQTLQSLNPKRSSSILVIPNGVLPELVQFDFNTVRERIPNSIAFWGTLDFPPNSSAVYRFYHDVFSKYLVDKDITWYVIGRNPQREMLELAQRHHNLVVTGPVDNLFDLVARIPIMINPMHIGGGLKNKVLEAFAVERLVVSNTLGMEAIPAEPGVHYVHAEKPEEFAKQILRYMDDDEERQEIARRARAFVLQNYTWEKVAGQYLSVIDRALGLRS